jgi:hypothetical protein
MIIQPGSFIHQLQYMPYMSTSGVAIYGPTNENSMITMNTMGFMSSDGVALYWMYF